MQPLMPKATAVWLIDNTTLTFDQIADFVGLHPLEVSGIADGEVAIGIKGMDPIAGNQLTRAEIARCENDATARLKILKPIEAPAPKKKAPRYTPLSKRQDRPAAIAWLVRNHPELADSQITKLLGTTKQTIGAIRDKTHWNTNNIQPVDPVALGLCSQIDLDAAVRVAAEKRAADAPAGAPADGDERLMSTEDSLADAPRSLKGFEGMESFGMPDDGHAEDEVDPRDAKRPEGAPDSFFNLEPGSAEEEEDDRGPIDADSVFGPADGERGDDGR